MSVRKKVVIGFTASLAILVASAIIAHRSAGYLIQNMAIVAHTHQLLAELRDIENVAINIQASVRGYIVTGEEDFLTPYMAASKEAHEEVQDVRVLVWDNAAQQRRLDAIEVCLADILKSSQETISLRKNAGFEGAKHSLNESRGKRTEAIKGLVRQMVDEENRLLEERNRQATRSVWWTNLMLLSGAILAVGIVAASVLLLLRHMREREELEEAILEISELEKQRLGRDLHDSLCQELTGIAFMCQAAKQKPDSNAPADPGRLGQISELVGKAIDHARSLAKGLNPVELESNGLMAALKNLALTTAEVFRVKCAFVCPAPVLVSDNAVALHLYRIAQEAVHNAIRHGKPQSIEIRLMHIDGMVSLEIQDDGTGIHVEAPAEHGMGLKTMSYRATMINAHFKVKRVARGGTLVRCVLARPETAPDQSKDMEATHT